MRILHQTKYNENLKLRGRFKKPVTKTIWNLETGRWILNGLISEKPKLKIKICADKNNFRFTCKGTFKR